MGAEKQVSCNLPTPTQNLALEQECLKMLTLSSNSSFCNIPETTISAQCQLPHFPTPLSYYKVILTLAGLSHLKTYPPIPLNY